MAGGEVQLVDLVKRFGDFTAVDGINVTVPQGEFFSLLGPSGCGKTTTLRMIAGFERPTEGQVVLDGVDVASVPPHKRNVNTVFQNYALFPHLNVEKNVAFGLKYQDASKEEATRLVGRALELVRLSGYERRRPNQLSGGQQQRVALARALILNPAVLLLDEPLGALDLKLRREMQVELKRLQREVGITFIFVTHDQNEALSMADRIAVMRAGDVLQDGTPAEVYESPVDRWVATFIGQLNFVPVTVEDPVAGSDDDWLVRTTGGLRAIATGGHGRLGVGDAAALALRPERLRVDPLDGQVGHRGRIASVAYLGDQIEVVVDSPELGELLARVSNDGRMPAAALRPGEEVSIGWERGAARLVADSA
jgi:spermidine/putrescine transport system ATP-binding protein